MKGFDTLSKCELEPITATEWDGCHCFHSVCARTCNVNTYCSWNYHRVCRFAFLSVDTFCHNLPGVTLKICSCYSKWNKLDLCSAFLVLHTGGAGDRNPPTAGPFTGCLQDHHKDKPTQAHMMKTKQKSNTTCHIECM